MLTFGGFFAWLTLETRRRPGWDGGTTRTYLLTRTVTAAVVGVSLIVAAIWKLRAAGYVGAAALLASAAVYRVLAGRLEQSDRASDSSG